MKRVCVDVWVGMQRPFLVLGDGREEEERRNRGAADVRGRDGP